MTFLLDATGTSAPVSFYIVAIAAVTLLFVHLVTETFEDEMAEDHARESRAEAARSRDAVAS